MIRNLPWHQTKVLFASLLVFWTLAFAGISYGLPDKTHLLSYNCDEIKWIEWLTLIRRDRNFSPHPECFDPTLYLGVYGATLVASSLIKWIPLNKDKEWLRKHVEIWSRYYQVGRLLQVFFGTLLLLALWFFSQKVYGWFTANFSTFLMATTPAFVGTSHFHQNNILVSLLATVSMGLLLLWSHNSEHPKKLFISAGFFAGLAMSTKYSAMALVFPFLYAAWLSRRRWKDVALTGLAAIFGFVLGTPFSVLDPRGFVQGFVFQAKGNYAPISGAWDSILFPAQYTFPFAMGWILAWGSLLSCLYLVYQKKATTNLLLVWIAGFYACTAKVGMMASPARVVIILPAFLLAFSLVFEDLVLRRAKPWFYRILIMIAIISTAYPTFAIVKLRRSVPIQKEASEWFQSNVPTNKKIGLVRGIYWYTPDIIYASYHHPDRLENPYPVTDLDFDIEKATVVKPDYILITDNERLRTFVPGYYPPRARAFMDWLESGKEYSLTRTFTKQVEFGGWEWKLPRWDKYPLYTDDVLWFTPLFIYKRNGAS